MAGKKCCLISIYYTAEHILRKVFNCTEWKQISDFQNLEISFKENLSIPILKIYDNLFLVILMILMFFNPSASGATAQPTFFHHSFLTFHTFHHFFLCFSNIPVQNLQLQLHNSHFTTANSILQLHKLSSVAR